MGLDPQCEAVLKALESMGHPPFEEMPVEQTRETCGRPSPLLHEPSLIRGPLGADS